MIRPLGDEQIQPGGCKCHSIGMLSQNGESLMENVNDQHDKLKRKNYFDDACNFHTSNSAWVPVLSELPCVEPAMTVTEAVIKSTRLIR